ncbi:MAG: efflux RND transporter periplasmic adaptor subunit [Candidatus Omnitrophica bacterium]|nr:efflux RND transporter periplasmic adaptor subunit [Candidatus Omnitrophota bacterium]
MDTSMDDSDSDLNLHQASTIGPTTKVLFFVFFLLAVGTVIFRVSGSVMEKTYPGMVVGYEVEVAPKVGGKIVRMAVEKNMPVEKGQVLAVLGDETLDIEISSASDELKKLKDTLEEERSGNFILSKKFDLEEKTSEVESSIDSLEIDLDQVSRQIRSASQSLQRTIDRKERAKRLLDQSVLTGLEFEAYVLEVESASDALSDLHLELEEKTRQKGNLQERVALYEKRKTELLQESNERLSELELEIRKTEGELERLLAQKQSLVVCADRSGIVSRDPKSEGELVSAGQPILYISTGEKIWVEANLPASDADALKGGDPVEIVAEKIHVIRLNGTVTGTLPILRTESRSSVGAFEDRNRVAVVMIEFDNPEEAMTKLRNGQSVIVRRELRKN